MVYGASLPLQSVKSNRGYSGYCFLASHVLNVCPRTGQHPGHQPNRAGISLSLLLLFYLLFLAGKNENERPDYLFQIKSINTTIVCQAETRHARDGTGPVRGRYRRYCVQNVTHDGGRTSRVFIHMPRRR